MIAETRLRRWIVECLSPLDAMPVENPAKPGTPDVEYLGGWIEVKVADKPKRGATAVSVRHYTQQQRIWARDRIRARGTCLFFIQVCHEYVLLDGAVAADVIGEASLTTLKELALKVWNSKPKNKDFYLTVVAHSPLLRASGFCSSDAAPAGVFAMPRPTTE